MSEQVPPAEEGRRLTEIITEGEALVAKGHASYFSHDAGAARALDILPRLLAVAKAAVEMVDADFTDVSTKRLHKAQDALRAAVRGTAAVRRAPESRAGRGGEPGAIAFPR